MSGLLSADLSVLPVWLNGLVIGLTVLVVAKGADLVVLSASRIATRLGVSELVIGLTVVALGTSAPEFAVTLLAAVKGMGSLSVGNIVGSNVFNMGLILGGAAMFRAIPVSRMLVRRDMLVLCCAALLLLLFVGLDRKLGLLEGVVLSSLLLIYLCLLFRHRSRHEADDPPEREPSQLGQSVSLGRSSALLLLGLALVVLGAHFMVEAASAVARAAGLSEWIIGVTIVAVGTSAPELATTIAAVARGRFAISAGNLVGSDIFNLLGVLGLTGLLRPVEVDAMARISLGGMLAMLVLALFFMRTGWRISRSEGALLVALALLRWVVDVLVR